MTPANRSLATLRAAGWVGDIVERWIGGGAFKVRKDFLGFADLVMLRSLPGFHGIALAVQASSGSNVSHRLEKMRETPGALAWLEAGGEIEIHGWAKRGARGKRKVWTCRVVVVTEDVLTQGTDGI